MSYCDTCLGTKLVAQLIMPWGRFVETVIPMKIGSNSYDISAQELLKKAKQVACPNCVVPKSVPVVPLDIKETVDIAKMEQLEKSIQ